MMVGMVCHIFFSDQLKHGCSPSVPGVLIGLQGGKNTVTEDVDLEVVCVEILSQETLVQEAVVDIFSIDGSAVSCGK